jgi:hypothetical protein
MYCKSKTSSNLYQKKIEISHYHGGYYIMYYSQIINKFKLVIQGA